MTSAKEGVEHCVVTLDRHEAYLLLQLEQLVHAFKTSPYEVYEIKCRCLIPDWGMVQNIQNLQSCEWLRIPDSFSLHATPTNASTVSVRRNGIAFESTQRHFNYPTPFESCDLSWQKLEEIIDCKTQEQLNEKFSIALFGSPVPPNKGHKFHFQCVNCQYSWATETNTTMQCPLCRILVASQAKPK